MSGTSAISDYINKAAACLRGVSAEEIQTVAVALRATAAAGNQIMIIGNGGSAAIASHFATDLSKASRSGDPRRSRARIISLVDNVPLLTMWANDTGYETVFAEQLRGVARRGDTLMVISGSGRSPNVLEALHTAGELGLSRVALLGFDGGGAKELADAYVHVRSNDYGHIEIAHSMITHLLTHWLALEFKW